MLPLLGPLQVTWVAMPATLLAIGVCVLTAFLLYRRITAISRLSTLLWVGVMGTIGWIIFAGLTHFNARQAFDFPPGAFSLSRNFFRGLGGAMLIAAYDIGGYYNVCFLGDEVKEPAKNIPRALFLSILAVVCLYILMNVSILGVIPWRELAQSGAANSKLYVVSTLMERVYGHGAGVDHLGAGDVDGLRFRVFADVGIFTRALCGGAGRKLFPRLSRACIRCTGSLMFRCWRSREWRRCSAFCGWRI